MENSGDRIQRAREAWISSLESEDRNEILFEIEALLVAIDRFVRPGDLPILGSGEGTLGYKRELQITLRALRRALTLARQLQNTDNTRAVLFGRFVEQSLLVDRVRDQYLLGKFYQDTPAQSFALLDSSIEHLIQVGNGLLRAPDVPAPVFFSYGMMMKSALYANRYFNPFQQRGFSVLFDRIDHPLIVRAIAQAGAEPVRMAAGLMILSCMRLLRYLNMVQTRTPELEVLQDSLPVFALIRSDMDAMIPIFRSKIPEILAPSQSSDSARKLLDLTEALTFQFDMEGRKAFGHVLKGAASLTKREALLSAVETAHGVLLNFVQQSIVWLVQTFVPEVQGREIFDDFISRREQSVRLREDIWILDKIVSVFEDSLRQYRDANTLRDLAQGISAFGDYFQSYALKHVRAPDMEAFSSLLQNLNQCTREDLTAQDMREHYAAEMHRTKIFLDTTLRCIGQRSDLQDVPFDPVHAGHILEQFLPRQYVQ